MLAEASKKANIRGSERQACTSLASHPRPRRNTNKQTDAHHGRLSAAPAKTRRQSRNERFANFCSLTFDISFFLFFRLFAALLSFLSFFFYCRLEEEEERKKRRPKGILHFPSNSWLHRKKSTKRSNLTWVSAPFSFRHRRSHCFARWPLASTDPVLRGLSSASLFLPCSIAPISLSRFSHPRHQTLFLVVCVFISLQKGISMLSTLLTSFFLAHGFFWLYIPIALLFLILKTNETCSLVQKTSSSLPPEGPSFFTFSLLSL